MTENTVQLQKSHHQTPSTVRQARYQYVKTIDHSRTGVFNAPNMLAASDAGAHSYVQASKLHEVKNLLQCCEDTNFD